MTEEEQQQLIAARQAYSYPAGRVQLTQGSPAPEFGGQFPFIFEFAPGEITGLHFDAELNTLLHNPDPLARARGLANVVFWGFLSTGFSYARNRVRWLVTPRTKGRRGLADEHVLEQLDESIRQVREGDLGEALGSLHGISQLSRLPFGSKAVAFLAPEKAGVLDSQIKKRLRKWLTEPEGTFLRELADWAVPARVTTKLEEASFRSVRDAYQAWCEKLASIASELNDADAFWTDQASGPQRWRALDVERAIFALPTTGAHIEHA